jgi:AmmeMemoRadiSam system protein B
MPVPERPQLHPHVACHRDPRDPHTIYLVDRCGLGDGPLPVSLLEFCWLQLFDGRRTLRDIQTEAMKQLGGQLLPFNLFLELVQKLDDALLLDGPAYREVLASPVREPACVGGCYPDDPDQVRQQMRDLFAGPKGPGQPAPPRPDGKLRAMLVPHIDYRVGGHSFAWGFKEVYERSDAALFVVIGTSHYSTHRFTLTRKHFKTPLGVVETDQRYIDRLVAHYGDGLFDDEHQAHLPEHSIELEVVFLQYLYGDRPIRIVPLVVGSFHDCILLGSTPDKRVDVGQMIEALRAAESETPEPVCYIISGDLAHIGPAFGDPGPLTDSFLERSRSRDQVILQQAETADAARYYEAIRQEEDRRRICGLPPTYLTLEASRPSSGKVLHYEQAVYDRGNRSVSYASVAFYR